MQKTDHDPFCTSIAKSINYFKLDGICSGGISAIKSWTASLHI